MACKRCKHNHRGWERCKPVTNNVTNDEKTFQSSAPNKQNSVDSVAAEVQEIVSANLHSSSEVARVKKWRSENKQKYTDYQRDLMRRLRAEKKAAQCK